MSKALEVLNDSRKRALASIDFAEEEATTAETAAAAHRAIISAARTTIAELDEAIATLGKEEPNGKRST